MTGEDRKLSALVATALLAAGSLSAPAAAQEPRHDFDIAPGSADAVVSAIAETTGDFILFPFDELREVDARGVRGLLTVREALERALDGSGLRASITNSGAISIRRAGAFANLATSPSPGPFTPPPSHEEPEEASPHRERIVVTGSRISSSASMSTPVPVTSLTSEEFDILSPTTLISGIDQLPQFVNNATPDYAVGVSGSVGQSLLNLRGIGSNRTLLLLDGRRIVASTRRGTTDIGILPEGLVRHVEIVTGGASATYGSDAVAGVVNFRLDTDFEGLRGHLQGGMSERGDYEHGELSLSAGVRLGERTHLLLAADAYRNEGVGDPQDREWHESWGLLRGPEGGPTFIVTPDIRAANYTYGGLITSGPLRGTQFLENGEPAPFDYAGSSGLATQRGGDGVDVAKERTIVPSSERQSAFAYLSRELSPDFTAYLQALYGRTRAQYDKDPNYMVGTWAATIFQDNVYLPDIVRQRMIDAGAESFPLSRYGSERDLGIARVDSENKTFSIAPGLVGDIGGWRLNAYYQYGRNQQDILLTDVARIDRIYQSMDAVRDPATGGPICRSTLSFPDNGCVPSSFFGDGAVSAEAKGWILEDTTQVQELVQHVADVAIDGQPFDLWAGPVSFAFGGAWRYDEYDQYGYPHTRDMTVPPAASAGYQGLPAAYATGNAPVLERAVGFFSHGKANVWELYGETIVPLAQEAPLVEALDLQAAIRYAHYEGSGGIWAWKLGLNWRVTPELRLRGTASRDVRAGTLAERYEQTGRAASVSDPTLPDDPPYSIVSIENGNPNVAPETADTLTAGVVYQPRWLPGFGLAADYYDIRISDAISQLGPQSIVRLCFEGSTDLCELIRRLDTGYIVSVRNTFLNVDAARTRGVDLEAVYETPIAIFGGGEQLSLRALASIYEEASLTPLGQPRIDRVGQTGPGEGLPDYRMLLGAGYDRGPWSIDLTASYVSDGVYNLNYVEGVDIDDNSVDSVIVANARLAYEFETARGVWEVYASANNLFDRPPPRAPSVGGGVFGTAHSPSDFDSVGRRYAVGLRWTY